MAKSGTKFLRNSGRNLLFLRATEFIRWFATRRICILLLLFLFLTGAASEDPVSCGCEEGETTAPTEIPGGGRIAASDNYALVRSQIGPSWEANGSSNETYRVSGTLGHYISQGRTLSDSYLVHHPMSRELILGGLSE